MPVTIVYPINGGKYPIADYVPPGCKLNSAYFTASFSVTCGGGPHRVEWGFNKDGLGKASFYDQISAQFVWKLPTGKHTFWVRSDCGEAEVKFEIG